jgi:hypothetical protein
MEMNYSQFQNCLRIQIVPDEYADERIEGLVEHCQKFGFTNVIFLTAGEEFFIGHATIEEITPYVEVIKKASAKLRACGITIGLHHWIGVGQVNRGLTLKQGQDFTTMVDFNGLKASVVACPMDENWQRYFEEFLGFLVREIKPDYYWIEDDFRLHNHAPLEWGGCFCDKHIAQMNSLIGTTHTRAEFCKRAFAKGKATKERKAWLDSSTKTMVDFAKLFYKIVKCANPTTKLGLMTSFPEEHCLEARDWQGIFDEISGSDQKLNRIHLPYFEMTGKAYMYEFNACAMAIRALSPKDTKIMPELETGSVSILRTGARHVGFQLESAIPLCLSGMTYNMYDLVSNGVVEEYGYADEVKRLTPYMQGVMDLKVNFAGLRGMVVPIDEKIVYEKEIKNNFYDLRTDLFQTASYVSAMGLNYQYSTAKAFKDETVFLFGDSVYLFTESELERLFADNSVVVDGGAVLVLKDRGLLSLLGATDATLYKAESGYQIYEQMQGDEEIFGRKGFRASCRMAAGDFVKIDYAKEQENEVLSRVYRADKTLGWASFVRRGNCLINPFVVNKLLYTQFTELRHHLLTSFVREHAKVIVDTGYEGINPYLYRGEEGITLMLVNASIENFDEIELYVKGVPFDKIIAVTRAGTLEEVAFSNQEGKVKIKTALPYLTTATFRLIQGG